MFDIISLAEFSRTHCISICAFLVPANLIATLMSLMLIVIKPAPIQRFLSVTIAMSGAIILSLHVASWWAVGIIQATTFILLALSMLCIALNIWAIIQFQQTKPWLLKVIEKTRELSFS